MGMDLYRECETHLLLAVICSGTPARGRKNTTSNKMLWLLFCLVSALLEFCTTVAFLFGRVLLCFSVPPFSVEGKDSHSTCVQGRAWEHHPQRMTLFQLGISDLLHAVNIFDFIKWSLWY